MHIRYDNRVDALPGHPLTTPQRSPQVLLVQGDSNSFPNLASNRNTSGKGTALRLTSWLSLAHS